MKTETISNIKMTIILVVIPVIAMIALYMCHIVERDVVTIERVTYGSETTLTTERGTINAGDDRRFEEGDSIHVGKNRAGQWILVNPK